MLHISAWNTRIIAEIYLVAPCLRATEVQSQGSIAKLDGIGFPQITMWL